MPRQTELKMNQENIHRYKNGTLNRVNVTSFTTGSIATMAMKGTPSPMNSLNINIPSQRAIAERNRQRPTMPRAKQLSCQNEMVGQEGMIRVIAEKSQFIRSVINQLLELRRPGFCINRRGGVESGLSTFVTVLFKIGHYLPGILLARIRRGMVSRCRGRRGVFGV
jgi:hypothetical protein